jgi:hypothetical protein
MLTVYIGATLQLGGALQKDGGAADFSGWAFDAKLYDQSGTTLIANLSSSWLDVTQGLLMLSASSTDNWPACKARIDVRLTTPTGDPILGPPTYLRIAQSPMS